MKTAEKRPTAGGKRIQLAAVVTNKWPWNASRVEFSRGEISHAAQALLRIVTSRDQ
ncbi:MAG TPA: hypothetical protein VOA41_03300 [Candidatus Dormibacteraeota bacterium]|nr:hypothetical protein [Candidatus Dormibacteraeota bacterium]